MSGRSNLKEIEAIRDRLHERLARVDRGERLNNLVTRIVFAAACCESFDAGYAQAEHERLYSNHGYRKDQDWRPGCGRVASGHAITAPDETP